MVKLLMQWDIKPGHETSYLDYYSQTFTPGLMKLGLDPSEVWYTYWGEGSQILSGFTSENVESLHRIFENPRWKELRIQLDEHVQNFTLKVLPATGRFQL